MTPDDLFKTSEQLALSVRIPDAGSAIITVAQNARDQCEIVEELRGKLFHELHPRKAELEREGWPDKAN